MAEKKTGKKNTRRETAETAKKPERNTKRFSPRARDIVMLVVVAVAILAVVSVYSPAIPWMQKGCYFLFGVLMYAAPVLVVILFLVLLYHEKTGPVFRRLFAALLFLFALSGIFSFAMKERDGGLLGRANFALFNSWLGATGAYIVNGLLIAISIVLAFNFTPFTYMENQRRRSNERLKERHAIREQARLQKEAEELERRKQVERDLEDKKARNKALEEYNREKDEKAEKNRERFAPRYGIGNTLITDEEPEVNTTFYQTKDALTQNAALFGNYKNSGEKSGTDNGDDTSFIPSISFAFRRCLT